MFTCVYAWSQTLQDTLVASQYFKTADSLLSKNKYDESIVFFEKALPIYQKHKVWERVAGCYNKISENFWKQNKNLGRCLINAKRALEVCEIYLDKKNKMRAIAFDNLGKYYEISSDFDNAILFFKKALDNRQKYYPKGHKALAISYSNLGISYQLLSEFEKALFYQKKSLSINSKVYGPNHVITGKDYNDIGNTYSLSGQQYKAIEYFKKDLSITIKNQGKNNLYVGYSYNGLGNTYESLDQYVDAINYYNKAIYIFKKEKATYPLFVVYNNLGESLSQSGQYKTGLEYEKKALLMAEKIYNKSHYNIAICHWNIGVTLEFMEEYKKSIIRYNKAIDIFSSLLTEKNLDIATLYRNLGNVYTKLKEYNTALKYYQKAIHIYRKINTKNEEIAITYKDQANLFLKLEDYEKSIKYSKKGSEIISKLYGDTNPLSIQFLNQIGNIYFKKRQYKTAIKYFNKAFAVNCKSKDFQNTYNPKLLIYTLSNLAQTYKVMYDEDHDQTFLHKSIATYKQADTLIQTMRQSFTNYKDKLTFSKTAKEVYEGAITAHLALYEVEKDQKSLEQAFYYAEKSKANTLKELLTDANAKKFTGLPDDLIALEKELRIEKSFYKSRITEELSNAAVDSTKISTFENELFRVNRSQDSLIEVLEQNYPKYHELKYQNTIVTVANIQQQLDDQTTVVEFFTSDSTTYAFTISKEAIRVKTLHTKELTKKIEAFRLQVIEKDLQQYKKQAHELYTTLFKPILDQLKGDQLLIIPDGSLWHLNFDLLLTQKPDSNNPADLPYLLREYAISYGNSANLLFSENTTTSTDVSKLQECLAFSFSDSTQVVDAPTMTLATLRDTGDDLPGTRAEIRAISEIIDGEYYYGSQAIEKNFKDKASQYNILHLALHGEVDNEHPENSKLYFTKSKDTLEDNLLYSHELFAMDIPAELTVLSACNTGSGKIAKGEGIMSLGSAFQYAGSKSLLLTNWAVSDRTTPELIQYFYKNLKEGMNKSKALQQAKLTYIKEADIHSRDPFYWGSFYLVGDTSAMHFEDNTLLYWAIGLGGIGLLFLMLLWYRISMNKQD